MSAENTPATGPAEEDAAAAAPWLAGSFRIVAADLRGER